MSSLRVVGPGRAGSSLALALGSLGWSVAAPRRRGESMADVAEGVDLVVIATPDAVIAEIAASIDPVESTVVAHLAGSLGLEVLSPHPRRAAIHPLVAMPSAEIGAERLSSGAWFAVAGDPIGARIVAELGGISFEVSDEHRAAHHAAAVIASNHVVALLGQAERVAATAGVPLEAYLDLVRLTVDNVADLGPAGALTGPAARGDWATIDRHVAALDPTERETYEVLVRAVRRLVDEPLD